MKYSKIRKEKQLKEARYFILEALKELDLINFPKFKTYATMIIKMYELNYYDKYENILEDVEEEALVDIIEYIIYLIDEYDINEIKESSIINGLIKIISVICVKNNYSDLADSLIEFNELFE